MPNRFPIKVRAALVFSSALIGICAGVGGTGRVSAAIPHGECADCHNTSSDSETAAQKRFKCDANVCLRCHASIVAAPGSHDGNELPSARLESDEGTPSTGRVPEPLPLAGHVYHLDCTACHNPHLRDAPFLLRPLDSGATEAAPSRLDAVSRACLRCHGDHADLTTTKGKHRKHPLAVRPGPEYAPASFHEPLPLLDEKGSDDRSAGLLGCTTCHLVHSGPNPYLLRWRRSEAVKACGTCHNVGQRGSWMSP